MRKCLLSLSFIFSSYLLYAQQTFTVKVTDAKTGNAITNSSVTIKATNKGATANVDGVFSIQAKPNDILEVTCIGYKPQFVKLTNATEVTVSLEPSEVDLADIVIIGTRGAARAKTETAVPIDVIKINQVGLPTAKMDLTSVLNMAAPSFNYNKQSGSDGADHIDLGTLRGLGPDQTLVLINGKRRHSTAFVALFGTRGRAASGADLNAFPQGAVDRIEILRDGASAQYGSDAMAGVINIVLNKTVNQWTINTGWGGYYDTEFNASKFNAGNQYYAGNKIDGGTFNFSANNGFALGKNGGFVNISLDLLTQGKTFRQVDTANWQTNKDALPYLNTGRRAFGDGSVTTGGVMYNMEVPASSTKKTTFYSFGGYNYKASDAYAYTRNWGAKPERFPVDASGNLLFDAAIMRKANDGEIYFNPHIQTHITDISFAAGIKGNAGKSWNWDLSNTLGKNDFHYYGDKTFNASTIGVKTPTHFDDGGFNFLQNTLNLDFSKSFKGVADGLNLGFGAEYRIEKYTIYAGEEASYKGYRSTELFYPNVTENRTPASGSQGFPGFSPSDVIKANRSNISLYTDAELSATKAWLIDGAVRFENFSDFGSIATFKLATRYKIVQNFNLRGSFSTGFRAPSLQQINFSNTLTSFSSGQLIQSRIARNGDAVSKAAGIPALKEETSVNASLGFAWKPAKGFTVTIDGYGVKVKDRVVLSGLFKKTDMSLPAALRTQLEALGVSTAQFFANAVNTTNYGIDVIADYNTKWDNKSFKAVLAGNFQKLQVDKINIPNALNNTELSRKTFYSDREIAFLKASAPNAKLNLSLEYSYSKFNFGVNITYYGKIQLLGFGSDAAPDNPNAAGINPRVPSDANGDLIPEVFNYNAKIVTDIFTSYKFSKKVTIFIGVDNMLNVHPDLGVNPLAKGWATDNESGGPWDSVQMGFNGRKLFTKLSFNF